MTNLTCIRPTTARSNAWSNVIPSSFTSGAGCLEGRSDCELGKETRADVHRAGVREGAGGRVSIAEAQDEEHRRPEHQSPWAADCRTGDGTIVAVPAIADTRLLPQEGSEE